MAVSAMAAQANSSLADTVVGVDWPVEQAAVALTSGRRVEITSGAERDQIVVRSLTGEVQLTVEVGAQGPILRFTSAELELMATRRLTLMADEVEVQANADLRVRTGGDMHTHVAGARHSHIHGAEQLEAASIEMQASDDAIAMRAIGKVALNGEHIGLNDDPCPQPFDWSALGDTAEDSND